MTSFTKPAPPVFREDSNDSEEQADAAFRQYNDDLAEYMFKYEWLPLALGEESFVKIAHLQPSMLAELYPWVAFYGPAGERWRNMLVRLPNILTVATRDDQVALATVRDLIDTYGDAEFFRYPQSTPGVYPPADMVDGMPRVMIDNSAWGFVYRACTDTFRGDTLLLSINDYDELEITRLLAHPTWRQLDIDKNDMLEALDNLSVMVLVNDLMRAQPAFAEVLATHDAFVARHGW